MGNNAAMTAFEATVIAVYDAGVLTPDLLDQLAEPYTDTDIDSGGLRGLTTKDGKELFQVVVETFHPGYQPEIETWEIDNGETDQEPDWYTPWEEITRARWRFC